ncbi:hypothetical protein BGZ96_008501 [Linnemannia gamsii]|uniref:PH domain-containing protein n=1 Tax=Linnemannia gamsii TaxID=64522 RepID=A0ABQ7JZ23_9FUNG|nr:hypothetical protein BGZ96_008501 [Linnemannia gamsii]
MSNYSSSSMSSLSTISTTSYVSPSPSPSPSSTSLYSTLPRSPLRKTATGGQHPLATVSTFESDPTTVGEATESLEADKSKTDFQQPAEESLAAETPLTQSGTDQATSEEDVAPSLDDISPDRHSKSLLLSAGQQTGSSIQGKKQEDLRALKSAVLSGSHNVLMLQIKAGTQSMNPELVTAIDLSDSQETSESDWANVAVTSGNTQPLSPLTASYPVSIHCPLGPSSTASIDTPEPAEPVAEDNATESSPPTQTTAETTQTAVTPTRSGSTTTTTPSEPKREFEMWMPPPPRSRPTQDNTHRAQPQPQHHSRLHFPRLLKQRSFNFPFTSSSSTTSPTSSHQSGSSSNPATRASIDGPSQAAGSRSVDHLGAPGRTASCDIIRPVGPPDPIPPHYQHLQNRNNRRSSSFRRRSHAGELERFSPGWVVVENSTQGGQSGGGAASPIRVSMSDDQATVASATLSEAHQRRSSATTSRRHVSLGVQPHLTSMWGRLLTSILPSGNDHHQHPAQDTDSAPNREREILNTAATAAGLPISGDIDPYLQQQRLLLTPLSQQQQIHPLYQQQLFFYADEVVSEQMRRVSELNPPSFQSGSEDASQHRRSMASESLRRADSPSFFTALANNAHLQGELAQEDGRESLEVSSVDSAGFVRPPPEVLNPALVVGGDTILAPRSLSADGKIPVSSLALSQPPSYWEAEIKYKGWPKIQPRPEQGQEALPRYTCSVFREGCVNRKTELVGNWRPYRRPWKRTFAHLRGTALRLYAVDMEDVPRLHVRNISLQLAKCEIATDYKQRPNVIRIRACDRTVLLECKDRIDALTWLEHLQAAANIATSLEDRSMPKIYTLPRAPPQSQSQQQQQQLQHQQGGRDRSAASSNARSSGIGSNVSSRQQTPQPMPPLQQPSLTQQQHRASVVTAIASPRSSIDVSTRGADSEQRRGGVRRSRSGGLLSTRSERNSSERERERDRRNNDPLSDEAVLRNVLRALGHTPDSNSGSGSSPSADENDEEDDSDNDEDDGQGTDAEAGPPSAAAAAAAAVGASARSTAATYQ